HRGKRCRCRRGLGRAHVREHRHPLHRLLLDDVGWLHRGVDVFLGHERHGDSGGRDVQRVPPAPTIDGPMPTTIDVFAKAREHEDLERLKMARELDALPYFHVLEGPTLPVVEMEGKRRIMLGSNNYLGLTGDERVKQGALDALNKYGTGLTGSRFLNGTIDLHLELEQELAEWLGVEAALVFTTGHQANLGALGTILAPGDTVIAACGGHASLLRGCMLRRATLRPLG